MRRRMGQVVKLGFLLPGFLLLTVGCGELGEVTALGGIADGMRGALPGVSEAFAHSCERRAAIVARIPVAELPPNIQVTPDCAPSKALAKQLGADQTALVEYLEALSKLGSGAAFTYGKAIGADVTTVNDFSVSAGVNATVAADAQKAGVAALTLSGKLADLATQHIRAREVRRIVLEANPGVQQLTAALYQAGDVDYGIVLANEKGFLEAYYEGPLAAAGAGDRLTSMLVQRQYDDDAARWQRRREAAVAYGAVMQEVGMLHAKLTQAARDRAGFAGRVKALTPEVNRLKDEVAKLQGEVQ